MAKSPQFPKFSVVQTVSVKYLVFSWINGGNYIPGKKTIGDKKNDLPHRKGQYVSKSLIQHFIQRWVSDVFMSTQKMGKSV